MKVLLKLYDCFSPYNRLQLKEHAPALAARGHSVVVAARSFHGLQAPADIETRTLGLGRRLAFLDFALVGWQMARLCRERGIDVVHFTAAPAQRGLWDDLALAVFRLLSPVPVVVGCHRPPSGGHTRLLASPLFRWTARRIMVPGPAMRAEMAALFPAVAGKLDPVFNAVCGPPRPYLLTLSRPTFDKGIDTLLFAFAGLLARGRDVDLIICGRHPRFLGIRLTRYRDLTRRLGLSERVHFTGHLEPPAASAMLQGCRSFVLASRWEGHSLAMLEAMAAGKAVVATRTGSAAETIEDGRDGLLVPVGEPAALERALDRVLTDERLREGLGQAARARAARDFSWRRHAESCEDVYRRALAP